MSPETVAARSAIESLRSGVPSRHAVEQMGTTQTQIREEFADALRALKNGEAARPLIVSASFGGGKSHLLNYLRTIAAAREHVVTSYVVVSPEMPLGNAHLVLKALTENAQAPGRVGKALRALTTDLRADSPAFADLRLWAREADLDDRFRALLHLYEASRGDDEFRARILDDIEGTPLLKTTIRQKLKEIGEAAGYDLRSPRNSLLAHDRVRLYARFVRACGCHGLVVFFDELERVGKFSIKQRIAAYEEMGWWKQAAEQAGSALLPVFAVTRTFKEETVTGGTHDEQRFQSSVLGSAAQDERDQRALDGIALLKEPYYFFLDAPTPEQMEEVKYRLKSVYEQAYGRSVPPLPPQNRDVRTTVRSEIRRWITHWDLARHYPDYAPDLETDEIVNDPREIDDEDLPPDEEGE